MNKKDLYNDMCEQSRFEAFFNKHSTNLYNFLYYKFGDKLDPQDKTQEAFVRLWENCKNIKPEKAKSYLFSIANNLMLNEVAHEKVVLKYSKIKRANYSNESPEFLMEEDEYREKLQKAIASLTEPQRVAFLMNRTEGKRFKEIAEILGISTKAVEKRIYGALKKLRNQIDEL